MAMGFPHLQSWRLSSIAGSRFCVDALKEAIEDCGAPQILNSDQGSSFTSLAFRSVLEKHGVRISMDGKARWIDDVFIERFR
jgi:putative transposase